MSKLFPQYQNGQLVVVKSKHTGILYQGEIEMKNKSTFVLRSTPILKEQGNIVQMNFGCGLIKAIIDPKTLFAIYVGNEQYNDQKVYYDYCVYPKSLTEGNYKDQFIGVWKHKWVGSTKSLIEVLKIIKKY